MVELICEECTGPVSKGITLGFSISAMNNSPNGKYSGDSKLISIHLLESSGWLKDSQNSLLPWTKPTQCDMIQVLSRLSKIKILGDWTTWYESVAIDDVLITNLKGKLIDILNFLTTN